MHSRSNGLLETPNRPPAEQVVSLISREVEQLSLVRSAGLVPIQPTARPMPQYFFDQLLDRAVSFQSRAEVKGAAEFGGGVLRPE